MADSPRIDRGLLLPLTLVGAYLVVVPFARELPNVLPATPSSRDWRFGAMGYFLNAMVLPVLGLAVIVVAALLQGRRRLLLSAGFVSLLLAVAVVVGCGAFYWDASGLIAGAAANALPLFRTAMRKTVAIAAFTTPALLALGLGGVKAGWSMPRETGGGPSPLISTTG